MSQKVRKTLIMIVMAALIICLMAASLTYTFTYGRYAGGKFNSMESPYDDLIEFVGAREYTVRSPEELIQAIKDGYSNIVIAEDAEEPFVITEGVTDVEANLVLNLNGKVVVRNSRNPMLDVQTNVSVVLVYDSKQTGAFYNPVGSSLMASGGSLTVGSGGYESGPRAEEYKDGTAAGTLGDTANATLFARSNETNNAVSGPTNLDRSKYVSDYSLVSGVSLPTITPKTTQQNNRKTVRGNVYLNSDYSDWLPADTFLIYTVEENCFIVDDTSSDGVTFESGKLYVNAEKTGDGDTATVTASEFTTPLCNVASCDFYYYYPISGTAGTVNSPQDYAVIYGYWDVMALARDDKKNETDEKGMATALKDSGLIYPYGAVRMVEGEGIVRGGTFSNHFDAVNTYGIYAEGGTLSVSKNTKVDTTFTTGGEGVCIRVQSAEAEDKTTGGSLTISGGEFSSKIGNTIEMSGGNMTVTKGTFTKDATGADPDSTDNGSAIDIQGGKLSMTGSDAKTFTITGSHVNGIKSSGGGTVTAEHTTFSMSGGTDVVPENGNKYGTDMFGINIDSGTVTANGCDITIYGTYSAGILSMGKNVDGSTVSVGAADNTASEIKVYVPESQKLLSSAGISSEGGKIQLTGDVNIETNGLGITARGPIDITGGEAKVTTTHGTGIYVSGATITNTATLTVESNITSGWSWVKRPENPDEDVNTNVNNGIYVENGSIDASAGTLNVTHTGVAGDTPADSTTDAATKSYAVFVKGDAEGGSQNTTVRIGKGSIAGNSAGGIYVSGGELTAGAVTVSAGGTALNDTFTAGAPTYAAGVLVETGTVTLSGAKIYSTALGVAVLGGNFKTEGTSSVTATRATGIYVQGGTVTNSGTLDVTSDLFDDSGNLYESAGADFGGSSTAGGNIYNGIFVNGGSLVSEGVSSILNVTFRGAAGDAPSSASGATKSYAVYVTNSSDDGATETTNTYASIREGALNAAQAGGVYVHGGDVVLGAQYNENDEVVGDGTVAINTGSLNGNTIDTSAGTYGAGVFADNGKAVLYGEVNVDCAAIGIVATAADTGTGTGAVTIKSGTTTITAYRSTGVYIRGGSLENSGTLTVDSKITNSTGGTASTAEDAYKWAGADIEGDTENENIYNGVYVKGGSLISNGTLNVTFTGVENVSQYSLKGMLPTGVELPTVGDEGTGSISKTFADNDNSDWYNAWDYFNNTSKNTPSFRDLQAQSYAIRVDGDSNTKVTVEEGDIASSVGGGIYIGGGGTVVLGESASRAPKIHADGKDTIATSYIYSFTRKYDEGWFGSVTYEYTIEVRAAMPFSELSNSAQNWAYRETKTGGDAVRMEGGTLTIHGGEYISKQGNGIVTVGGTTTINQGTFLGADTYRVRDTSGMTVPAGPAASYAFKVYGGTITVKDGTFGNTTSSASGGFVMGTSEQQGTADIYGGDFVVGAQHEDGTAGQAGFGVYNHANVTFGRTGDPNANINVTGLAAGLVLEQTNGDSGTIVTINSGTFSSSRTGEGSSDGVWYGNNTSRLEIIGGQFTGVSRSGLYFEVDPGSNVQLSGGTYRGGNNAWYGNSPSNITTGEILTSNAWLYDNGNNPIVYASRRGLQWSYTHLGGKNTSVALNGALSVTAIGGRDDPLSEYKYIAITANSVTDSNILESAAENRNKG